MHDDCLIKIKYSYPEDSLIEKLVVFVNGSGPNTYENRRQWVDGTIFNYHDLFIEEFNKRGIAYCSYNTRGVNMGAHPPLYADINDQEYKTYLPSNSVKDLETIINHLRQKNIFKNVKIYLLGWSEGTIIGPIVALNNCVKIDALLLAGYCNENLKDILITKDDFMADTYNVRKELLADASFEELDANGDGRITAEDAGVRTLSHLSNMLRAIETSNDEWLKNNHGIRLTTGWFNEHFNLKPNKEILPLLDLPIFIFQGEYDAMCSKHYAEDIKREFKKLGKTNLTVSIFDDHDHDLNYHLLPARNEVSVGIQAIFNTAYDL